MSNYSAKQYPASKKPRMTLQQGFTLIEIMIAAFVLAIGLLGVGALNLRSLKNNGDAINRTQAVMLAYDMAERIRANPAGNYTILATTAPSTATDCASGSNTCSSSAIATFDLSQWKCQMGKYASTSPCTTLAASDPLASASVQNGLPNGEGSISKSTDTYTITVTWFDPGSFPTVSCTTITQAACQSSFVVKVMI